jgi:phospholipid/cholesterol/gamma-HCH transport system substrate-binding protein
METKVNYIIVGLFAVVLSVALIAGILWLSASKRYSADYETYVAYMQESVSGLNLNAPVKYRGVEVGQVRQIALDKTNLEQVRLELSIERGITIRQDTIATMRSQGLTGIAYIELSGGSGSSAILAPTGSKPFPVIKTGTSLMGRVDTAMTGLITSLNKTTDNLNTILDENNRGSLKRILADVATITGTLAAHKAELDKTISNTSLSMEGVAKVSVQLPELMQKLSRSAEAIEKMAKETSRASSSVSNTFEGIGPDAKRFAADGLPELEKMLASMREMMASLQRVTEQLENDPSLLLRGKETRRPGPGE